MMRLFCISTKYLASSPVTVLVGSEFSFGRPSSSRARFVFYWIQTPMQTPVCDVVPRPIFVLTRLNKI